MAMTNNNTLDSIVIEPNGTAKSCVIWLHGLGDSGAGFAPIVPHLALPKDHSIRFIFPHAPEQAVTINGGYIMRSWYDIKSMELDGRAFMPDVLVSEKQILALIEQQIAKGIPSERIVLIGFSQGGVMSLFTGSRCKYKLAGIAGLSCYLADDNLVKQSHVSINKTTPMLLNHGEHDDVVPCFAGHNAYMTFKEIGYAPDWQVYPVSHELHAEQVLHLGNWLQKL